MRRAMLRTVVGIAGLVLLTWQEYASADTVMGMKIESVQAGGGTHHRHHDGRPRSFSTKRRTGSSATSGFRTRARLRPSAACP